MARKFIGTKRVLVAAGEKLPERGIYGMLGVYNYAYLGWWLKRHNLVPEVRVSRREQVFQHVARPLRDRAVLYLEFGVAGGASLRAWAQLFESPDTQLHGFDSFDGLPSDWIPGVPAGFFASGGQPPQVDDSRVVFHVGWFNETLPQYEWPDDYDDLVITLDADLYSSTDFVLRSIQPRLAPGTILYFDEFNHYADELRAFDELIQRTGWQFEALAATRDLSQIALRRVA